MNYESWQRDPHGIEEPHDVLAADEFGIGTRDERLPPDPNRFDPPTTSWPPRSSPCRVGGEHHSHQAGGPDPRRLLPLLLIVAIAAFLLVRRR